MRADRCDKTDGKRRRFLPGLRVWLLVAICATAFSVVNQWLMVNVCAETGHWAPLWRWPPSELVLALLAEAVFLFALLAVSRNWRRARWRALFQFRLRTLLAATLVVSFALGYWLTIERQRQAAMRES